MKKLILAILVLAGAVEISGAQSNAFERGLSWYDSESCFIDGFVWLYSLVGSTNWVSNPSVSSVCSNGVGQTNYNTRITLPAAASWQVAVAATNNAGDYLMSNIVLVDTVPPAPVTLLMWNQKNKTLTWSYSSTATNNNWITFAVDTAAVGSTQWVNQASVPFPNTAVQIPLTRGTYQVRVTSKSRDGAAQPISMNINIGLSVPPSVTVTQ